MPAKRSRLPSCRHFLRKLTSVFPSSGNFAALGCEMSRFFSGQRMLRIFEHSRSTFVLHVILIFVRFLSITFQSQILVSSIYTGFQDSAQLLKQAVGRMIQVSSTFFAASMEVSPSVVQFELTTSSPSSKQARRDHLTMRASLCSLECESLRSKTMKKTRDI